MKSGITLALLIGAATGIGGAIMKVMHLPGANAMMIAGLFVTAIAFVFRMLQNAPQHHE